MKTKIICTLGPASNTESILRKMAVAGMSIARFNFSHGSHKEHLRRIHLVRRVNEKYGFNVKILQDLEGYRIRVGSLPGKGSIEVARGETVYLGQKELQLKSKLIPFDYEGPLGDFQSLDQIFIDDGNICLKILKAFPDRIKAEVIVGGRITSHKGINVPGIRMPFEGLSEKDEKDAAFGIKHKVDYMAQSFVRKAEDMIALRKIVKKEHPRCKFIAKIENEEGVMNFDDILDVSDGIMVARGDLGVSLPMEMVPFLQKMIITKCNLKRKMDITATQILESMVDHIRPTRAEVSDIANAVLEGSDFLMLSAETAKGRYPVESIQVMNKVIRFSEKSQTDKKRSFLKLIT